MLSLSDISGRKLALLIVLAVVACAAIFGAVVSVRHSVSVPAAPPPDKDEMTFLCVKCGELFTVPRSELPGDVAQGAAVHTAVDCPKCHARASGYVPARCPNCGKYYVSQSVLRPPHLPPIDPAADRCPHCGTSAYEWHLKNVKPKI